MNFIRPEIRQGLLKWRGAIFFALVAAIGLYYFVTRFGAGRFVGLAVLGIGMGLMIDAIRRARFPDDGGGPGIVTVDERRIVYFGPLGGGSMSIDELERVSLAIGQSPSDTWGLRWQFQDLDNQLLTIPSDAEGAAALYDALAALPGVDLRPLTQGHNLSAGQNIEIWTRG